eukprot:343757_1
MMSLSQDNQQQSIYTLTSYITSPNKNGTPAKTAHTTNTIVNNSFNHTKPQTLSKAIGIGKLKFKNGLNNKNYNSKTHTTTIKIQMIVQNNNISMIFRFGGRDEMWQT